MTARTADALADLLAEIALRPRTPEADAEVAVLAWPGHTPESREAALVPFRGALQDREAPGSGERARADLDPAAAAQQDAGDRACERADAACSVLAYGPPPSAGESPAIHP